MDGWNLMYRQNKLSSKQNIHTPKTVFPHPSSAQNFNLFLLLAPHPPKIFVWKMLHTAQCCTLQSIFFMRIFVTTTKGNMLHPEEFLSISPVSIYFIFLPTLLSWQIMSLLYLYYSPPSLPLPFTVSPSLHLSSTPTPPPPERSDTADASPPKIICLNDRLGG